MFSGGFAKGNTDEGLVWEEDGYGALEFQKEERERRRAARHCRRAVL